MIGQGKAGWWIASLCAAVVLASVSYGMGRRAALRTMESSMAMTPAGAPLPTIQIDPIQPQEELAAIQAAMPPAQAAASAAGGQASPAGMMEVSLTSAPVAEEAARVRQLQLALKAAGFDPGSADGRMGPRTKAAIRDFQLANGLTADGKAGPKTWAKLEPYLNDSKQQRQGSAATAD